MAEGSERVMLTWNIPNWITVVLMVILAYLVVSLVTQFVRRRMGGDDTNPMPGSMAGLMGVFGNALAPAA